MTLEPKPGFDWTKVRWSGPLASVDETCSYCGAPIPDEHVPLRLWNETGWAAVLCDACMKTWWGLETFDDDDRDPPRACWRCGGEGWGVVGDDWDSDDPINGPYPGEIQRCPCCGGSGDAEDCTFW